MSDYRLIEDANLIPSTNISFTGKMIASDLKFKTDPSIPVEGPEPPPAE